MQDTIDRYYALLLKVPDRPKLEPVLDKLEEQVERRRERWLSVVTSCHK